MFDATSGIRPFDPTDGGNQDFVLGGAAFTETAGELIQFTSGGKTIIAGDTNGDASLTSRCG